MWKPIYQPEPWPQFVKRKDIKGLPLMEQRKKYMQEQILFENYLSTLNTLNTVSPSVSSAASGGGGPLPGGGNDPYADWDIVFKINTNYQAPPEEWNNANPTTRIWMWLERETTTFFKNGYSFFYNYVADGPTSPMTIDWGDGDEELVTTYNVQESSSLGVEGYPGIQYFDQYMSAHTHSYASDGEYIVKIKGDSAYDMQFTFLPLVDIIKYDPTLAPELDNIFQMVQWEGWEGTEADLANWDLNGQSLESTFAHSPIIGWTSSFLPTEIESWDISGITSIQQAFIYGKGELNLGNWDFTGLTNQSYPYAFASFVSGARYDLWEAVSGIVPDNSFSQPFFNAFRDNPGRTNLPPIYNWDLSLSYPSGHPQALSKLAQSSGISDEMWNEALVVWAADPETPVNYNVASQVGGDVRYPWYRSYFEASGSFKTESYNEKVLHIVTTEASGAYATLTAPTGSGGYGWTMTNVVIAI